MMRTLDVTRLGREMRWVRIGTYMMFLWVLASLIGAAAIITWAALDPVSSEDYFGLPPWVSSLLYLAMVGVAAFWMGGFERRIGCFVWPVALLATTLVLNNVCIVILSLLDGQFFNSMVAAAASLMVCMILRSAHATGKVDQQVRKLIPTQANVAERFETAPSEWIPPPRLLRVGFKGVAVCLAMLALFSLSIAIVRGDLRRNWSVPAVASLMAVAFWRHFRRSAIRDPRLVRSLDSRRPVLFLRSFLDDRLGGDQAGFRLGPEPAKRFEEDLIRLLWNVGPVIAIGKPGEREPLPGAAREYADDWKRRVAEIVPECGLVLLVLGTTPGLLWEIDLLITMGVAAQKLVVVVPPVDADEVAVRWECSLGELKRAFVSEQHEAPFLHKALIMLFDSEKQLAAVCSDNRLMHSYDAAVALIPLLKGLSVNETSRQSLISS